MEQGVGGPFVMALKGRQVSWKASASVATGYPRAGLYKPG